MVCLSGEWDEIDFFSVLKEPGYHIMMRLNFSGLTIMEFNNEEIIMFKYTKASSGGCKYRGVVYNHHTLRHDVGTKSQIGL